MMPLEPPDSFRVLAAHGWLELGCPAEAAGELKRLAPELRQHPEVLRIRWTICARAEQWAACVEIGEGLVAAEPDDAFGWINRSYALRRAPDGGVQAAYDALQPAVDRVEDLEQVTFNLGCYACLLGQTDAGRVWLGKSFAEARRVGRLNAARANALNEPDLEPLWKEVAGL